MLFFVFLVLKVDKIFMCSPMTCFPCLRKWSIISSSVFKRFVSEVLFIHYSYRRLKNSSFFPMFRLKFGSALLFQNSYKTIILQIYAGSFFAIPLVRWFVIRIRNTDIEKRNQVRERFARALELPDISLRRKVAILAPAFWFLHQVSNRCRCCL